MAQDFNKQQGQNQTGANKSNVTPSRQDQGQRQGDMARERDLDRSKSSDRSTTKERI